MTAAPKPPAAASRLDGLDLARGLAVAGMVIVNFKFVMGLEGVEAGWLGTAAGLFDGRAAATFVTLAGMGVSLLSRRARESKDPALLAEARAVLVKRAAFLLAAGVLDSYLWIGDILHFYAAYLLAAALLVDAEDRTLYSLAGLSAIAFVPLYLFLDYEKGWDWELFEYAGQWAPEGLIRHLFFNGFHPVFPWISFLLLGMVLGRKNLDHSKRRLFLLGLALIIASESASRVLAPWAGSDGTLEAAWCAQLFGTQSMPPAPLYVISGGGSALAVIAACLYLADRFRGRPWLSPFMAAGQLALSLYLAHVVFGMGALEMLEFSEGRGIGLSLACSAAFYAAALAFAWNWRRGHERGPVEALMRRVAA